MTMSKEWQDASDFFVSAFSELMILFVLISFLVSLINHYLPQEKVKMLLSGNKGYLTAIGLGSVTPFCSCSSLPMMIGLLKAKADFGPTMAFLLTSPLINPFVVSLFWVTFGPETTIIYTVFALAMALMTGMFMQKFNFLKYVKKEYTQDSCKGPSACSDTQKCGTNNHQTLNHISLMKKIAVDTLNELIKLLPYMTIGIIIGAIVHGFIPTDFFIEISSLSPFIMIPIAALVGVFLYVRASTMIPIATSLLSKGMSMGSVISLTVAGAGASLPEMIILKRLFHWPLLLAFIFTVFTTACVTGYAIDLLGLNNFS